MYDFILYILIVQAKGAMATQTILHHLLGCSAFYMTYYTEGVPVVFGVISLAVELSTINLNLRWFTFEFKIKSPMVALINSSVLCLSYFLSRILYQTYISVGYAYPAFY